MTMFLRLYDARSSSAQHGGAWSVFTPQPIFNQHSIDRLGVNTLSRSHNKPKVSNPKSVPFCPFISKRMPLFSGAQEDPGSNLGSDTTYPAEGFCVSPGQWQDSGLFKDRPRPLILHVLSK